MGSKKSRKRYNSDLRERRDERAKEFIATAMLLGGEYSKDYHLILLRNAITYNMVDPDTFRVLAVSQNDGRWGYRDDVMSGFLSDRRDAVNKWHFEMSHHKTIETFHTYAARLYPNALYPEGSKPQRYFTEGIPSGTYQEKVPGGGQEKVPGNGKDGADTHP